MSKTSFFVANYKNIHYPISSIDDVGLRNSQFGAIHAIASHFTVHNKNAIVSMPTGTGKTAVLMMSAFVLRAKRVLVITPSRLVRNQIANDFRTLRTLQSIDVLRDYEGVISVSEQSTKIQTQDDWDSLSAFDVVVSTPNCVSPSIADTPDPPEHIFDLVLIDEAHHSPANTWTSILKAFPNSKKILFTATPFRRDSRQIDGVIIYSYPLQKAFEDGDFGQIRFEAVNVPVGDDVDKCIARKAEEILLADRVRGLPHVLMVRTDKKARANDLADIYKDVTSLRLQNINSDHSYSHIQRVIRRLQVGELDGIICVDMLGEGFDFPNLKIAAVHSPHKSLEVTLQFIGRFSRVRDGLAEAKFIAIPNEIELEAKRIYSDGAVWQEIISNLSENRIQEEIGSRRMIEGFDNLVLNDENLGDLSLFSLKPYYHVKIYSCDGDVDLNSEIDLSSHGLLILRSDFNDDNSILILLLGEIKHPRWAVGEDFDFMEYNLVIVYHDVDSGLLFINSSIKGDAFYSDLAEFFLGDNPSILSTNRVNRVLTDISDAEFFNVGMKNTILNNKSESYRIYSGSKAHRSIRRSDGHTFGRGHLFAKGKIGEYNVTIGLSSASKVWSNKSSAIPIFVEWCRELARKITSDGATITGTELDYLRVPDEIHTIPEGFVLAVDWNEQAYRNFAIVHYSHHTPDGSKYELTDIEFRIDHIETTNELIVFWIQSDSFEVSYRYSYTDRRFYFAQLNFNEGHLLIEVEDAIHELTDYINEYPLRFYFSDFSVLEGYDYYRSSNHLVIPFSEDQIETFNWDSEQVDILSEINNPSENMMSIQEYINDVYLANQNMDFIFCDHGRGEAADFITASVRNGSIRIQLYHVKASNSSSAGDRVNDVYEVTGQVVRSLNFLDKDKILTHLERRQKLSNPDHRRRDDVEYLRQIINENPRSEINWEVILVQPGISKGSLSSNIANNLAAVFDFCKSYGCHMRVIGSH